MTMTVYLYEDMMGRGLSVMFADNFENGPGRVILRLSEVGTIWESIDADDLTTPLEPTFRLPAEAGRALLDALMRHYNGAEDTRALRRDYDAERRRVDEQAKVLADVARTLAGKVGA